VAVGLVTIANCRYRGQRQLDRHSWQALFKTGLLVVVIVRIRTARSGYTGNLSFNTSATRSTGNTFADALLGNFRSYNEADNDPIGFFRLLSMRRTLTDNWKAARNLSFEFGARLYHFQPRTRRQQRSEL